MIRLIAIAELILSVFGVTDSSRQNKFFTYQEQKVNYAMADVGNISIKKHRILNNNSISTAYFYLFQKEDIEVKAGVPFEIDDLVITISSPEYSQEWVGRYLGQVTYFFAAPVRLSITNTDAGKIKKWKGCYSTVKLEDEHGNSFETQNILGWTFFTPSPDTGVVEIDPKETIQRVLYFRVLPRTSKKFKLTIPYNGKKIICTGEIGESEKRENERREKEEMVKRKLEEEVMVKEKAKMEKIREKEEKQQKEKMLVELKRKEEIEAKGGSYYPLPTTPHDGKNAEEWYKLIRAKIDVESGLNALVALEDESIPFIIELLKSTPSHQGRYRLLSCISPKGIHPNDIPKIIAYLDRYQNQTATRVLALDILAKSGKTKDHKEKIRTMAKDLLANQNVSDLVKTSLAEINKNN